MRVNDGLDQDGESCGCGEKNLTLGMFMKSSQQDLLVVGYRYEKEMSRMVLMSLVKWGRHECTWAKCQEEQRRKEIKSLF